MSVTVKEASSVLLERRHLAAEARSRMRAHLNADDYPGAREWAARFGKAAARLEFAREAARIVNTPTTTHGGEL